MLLLGYLMQASRLCRLRWCCKVRPSVAGCMRCRSTHPAHTLAPFYHPLLRPILQYTPTLGMAVLKRVGPARAQALKEGRSGYDTAAIIKSASTASLRE